jgi:diguanylate cyclase (GGDEF)-like protein
VQNNKSTILVVDDQPADLETLLSFLKQQHLHVRIASSGEQALHVLSKYPADIILLDVKMPDMDGFETCRLIKENKESADIPIIFMTPMDSIDDKVTAFESGGVDYIIKPFQQVEVLARINTHITLRKKGQELEKALSEVTRQKKLLEKLSRIDDLTGLFNRRHLNSVIAREFNRSKRHNIELSCLLLDLDFFKRVNDTFGHEFGDFVIQEFAAVIQSSLRISDFAFRYGGEEFLILLPQTETEGALQVAEKIRQHMEANTITDGDSSVTVTVSIGVASFCQHQPSNRNELIAFTDKALYVAKRNGRNQVQVYGQLKTK